MNGYIYQVLGGLKPELDAFIKGANAQRYDSLIEVGAGELDVERELARFRILTMGGGTVLIVEVSDESLRVYDDRTNELLYDLNIGYQHTGSYSAQFSLAQLVQITLVICRREQAVVSMAGALS
jgi:hypothetical protein